MTPFGADRLPGMLGHELRNPLASAMTGAMLAREMIDADDPRGPVLDGVLRDLDRMSKLTDGWLALAKSASVGKKRLAVDEFVRSVAARHGAEVVVSPAGHEVDGNPALLERALDNLCENAKQAGAKHIRIAVQSLAGDVTIHVEDDGRGVAREDAARVFDAGWTSGGGAGLGLFAVATTAAAHRGSVRCVPLARGTRFSLSLPLVPARTAPTALA